MVLHIRPCKVCGESVKKTRSRPIDVCTRCKHIAWTARAEARGVDIAAIFQKKRDAAGKVFYDAKGGKRSVSRAEYNAMFESQKGVCGCCKQPETHYDVRGGLKRLSIDHCHETGKIRGLLCGKCNRSIGGLGDTIAGLERALAYLRQAEG